IDVPERRNVRHALIRGRDRTEDQHCAYARTDMEGIPSKASGTALKVAPCGTVSSFVKFSTIGTPAARRIEWTGRDRVVVPSTLAESIPTRATPRSTSSRAVDSDR